MNCPDLFFNLPYHSKKIEITIYILFEERRRRGGFKDRNVQSLIIDENYPTVLWIRRFDSTDPKTIE